MMKQAYTLLGNQNHAVTSDRMAVMLSALADLAGVNGQPLIQMGLLAAVMFATTARNALNSAAGPNMSESNSDSDQIEINKRRALYAAARVERQRGHRRS